MFMRRILAASATFLVVAAFGAASEASRPIFPQPRAIGAQQRTLVYGTGLLSLTSGFTDIYAIGSSGATLVGALSRGGGGPVAVDAHENVYVIQADYDNNFYEQNSQVFVYQRGSSKPIRHFKAPGFGALAMTIGSDGSVYMAGSMYPNTSVFRVLRFAPGATVPQFLPRDLHTPKFPLGMAVDAAGDVFVGWLNGGACSIGPLVGCVDVLPAGQNAWQTRLPPDSAANSMFAGPIALSDGSLVLYSGGFNFSYLETVPTGSIIPSQLAELPQSSFHGGALVLDGAGSELWGIQTGLGGGTVTELNYPSGSNALSFMMTAPNNAPFLATGLAVSPAHFP